MRGDAAICSCPGSVGAGPAGLRGVIRRLRFHVRSPRDAPVLACAVARMSGMFVRTRLSGNYAVAHARRLAAALRPLRVDPQRGGVSTAEVERHARIFHLAGSLPPFRPNRCLYESLLLFEWLCRWGCRSTLNFGAEIDHRTLRGHAWVTIGGHVVATTAHAEAACGNPSVEEVRAKAEAAGANLPDSGSYVSVLTVSTEGTPSDPLQEPGRSCGNR